MFAYCGNNPVIGYDPTGQMDWGIFASGASLLGIGAIACAAAITVATGGTCTPLLIAACVTFAAGGMTVLNGAAEIGESITEYNFMRDGVYGGNSGFYQSQKMVFATTSVVGTAALGASSNSFDICFVEGTTILSGDGVQPIELIKKGDRVWAWNEETGEIELKRVIETYVNEATELLHVFVNDEEIITTLEHPFYTPVKGWTSAAKLRAGDILVLVNGEYAVVEKVQHELLETPVTVYNFQVEDNHTYYVSSLGVLVHNSCNHNNSWRLERVSYWRNQAKAAEKGADYGSYTATQDNIDRMMKGLAPKGWDGRSVELHHWNGIANDFYNYSAVSRTLHLIIHSARK